MSIPTSGDLAARVKARVLHESDLLDAHTVSRLAREEAPLIAGQHLADVVADVLAHATGLGPLEPLLADPQVTEVMISGSGRVWIERRGALQEVPPALEATTVEHLIEKIVGPLGLRVDRASPMVDARLPDGSRVNAVVPPLAVDGPCLTIRRFAARAIPLESFCPPAVADLLAWAVETRMNIVVSGATSSGKTTLLNALAARIPAGERIITVEDAAELRLPQDHVVRLEARPANAEGAGEVRVRDLVRNALRMRPDRIVVGEVRDSAALDMLQAMNTGHDGSLSTCHANGPLDALRRLETMVLMGRVNLPLAAVREQIASALDLVVQVARRSGGARAVVEVAEIVGPGEVRSVADSRTVTAGLSRPPRSGIDSPPPPLPAPAPAPPSGPGPRRQRLPRTPAPPPSSPRPRRQRLPLTASPLVPPPPPPPPAAPQDAP
ncbi:MAG TPA: CpaF family protein [Acidimicrobiales bacterium]|nr:CpaF family protein [Acidimicrobiales bacterium]